MGGFGVWMEASPSFEVEDDNEHCSTSATSSIGNDSDVLSETECGDNEAHSTYKCHQPLDTMDSLQQVLPIRFFPFLDHTFKLTCFNKKNTDSNLI